MRKLRLALSKGEEIRFLSHLDYAQAVERMIRRAEIKMAYSEGFNPHMKISFSSALALGITASVEYLDMEIIEDDSVESIITRLNEVAPPGLNVIGGKEVPRDVKKMMATCNYADYIITIYEELETDWEKLAQEFNAQEHLIYEKVTPKKTKEVDAKEYVHNLSVQRENNAVKLKASIGIYPQGTIKPSEILKIGHEKLNWPNVERYDIHRQAIMIEENGVCKTPLEV